MILKSAKGTYEIGTKIGGQKSFNVYVCRSADGAQHILKIAFAAEHNSVLDREAVLLRDMRQKAEDLERAYGSIEGNAGRMLNYQIAFPYVVESFLAPTQGNRRVNIMSFDCVDDIRALVPLRHVRERDRVRIDPKTSAWILGKFLKLLVFTHSQGISLGSTSGYNFLIERDEHYSIVFDWTSAVRNDGGIPEEIVRREIASIAREVLAVLDADFNAATLPESDQDPCGQYARHLFALANGCERDASQAHARFYELVRTLWPERGYWPFTSHTIESEGR